MIRLAFILSLSLLCSGCLTLKYDDNQASLLTSRGMASIQGSQEEPDAKFVGPKVVRYYVSEIDKPPAKIAKQNEVLPLEPGNRTVTATAYVQIPRFGGFDLHTAAAQMEFLAEAGKKYQLKGRVEGYTVVFGIYDLATQSIVSKELTAHLIIGMQQRAPAVIFIP